MKHVYELDSLRGIAALAVVLSHILSIFPKSLLSYSIEYGPARIFVAGSEGVILFFILSGFVLFLPFSTRKIKYQEFLIKRFFRIYIPYVIAIIIAFLAAITFYSGELKMASSWFNSPWTDVFDLSMLLGHLSLIASFDMGQLNPVIWSLVHEFRISLIFPLLMLVVLKYNIKKLMFISFSITVVSALLYFAFKSIPTDFLQTVYYCYMFVVGAMLAKYRKMLINKVQSFSKKKSLILFLIALFSYIYVKPSFIMNAISTKGIDVFYRSIIDGYFTVFGASLIIIFALSSKRFSNVLVNKPLMFLGKISYSLYLYHCIALLTIFHVFSNVLPIALCITIALILSFVLATFSYFYIELPAISLGRKILKIDSKKKNEVSLEKAKNKSSDQSVKLT